MPITTNVLSSNPAHGEVYSIQHYVIKFVSDLRQAGRFPPGTPASSTNKTDYHDITETLLKVALSTINITLIYVTHKSFVERVLMDKMFDD